MFYLIQTIDGRALWLWERTVVRRTTCFLQPSTIGWLNPDVSWRNSHDVFFVVCRLFVGWRILFVDGRSRRLWKSCHLQKNIIKSSKRKFSITQIKILQSQFKQNRYPFLYLMTADLWLLTTHNNGTIKLHVKTLKTIRPDQHIRLMWRTDSIQN